VKELLTENIIVSSIQDEFLQEKNIRLDLLRLDLIHPLISGNKWFKLKYNIRKALLQKAEQIVSFGGAYSNHLHALAFAGKLFNINTAGIIRGEEITNATLEDCKAWGMELHFITRDKYRHKNEHEFIENIQQKYPSAFIIPEGGNNEEGRKGTSEILAQVNLQLYTHIACPVGTSATISGLIESSLPSNTVIGIAAIKNGQYLDEEIRSVTNNTNWSIEHCFHFGGFAKKTPALISFMNYFTSKHGIDIDFIYNAKMLFGMYEMIRSEKIKPGSQILAIHTGGLQGNRSL